MFRRLTVLAACTWPSLGLFSHHDRLCVVVVYLCVCLPWPRRHSSADIVTFSGHALPRLFRFSVSCSQQLLWEAPAHVIPWGHIAAANLPLCRLHFIKCAESALVSFPLTAMLHGKFGRLDRPATVCRRPGWGTWVTPSLHYWSMTSPVCRGLALVRMSLLQLHDQMHAKRRQLDAAVTGHPLLRTALSPTVAVHCLCRYVSMFADKPAMYVCDCLFVVRQHGSCVLGLVAATRLIMQ